MRKDGNSISGVDCRADQTSGRHWNMGLNWLGSHVAFSDVHKWSKVRFCTMTSSDRISGRGYLALIASDSISTYFYMLISILYKKAGSFLRCSFTRPPLPGLFFHSPYGGHSTCLLRGHGMPLFDLPSRVATGTRTQSHM